MAAFAAQAEWSAPVVNVQTNEYTTPAEEGFPARRHRVVTRVEYSSEIVSDPAVIKPFAEIRDLVLWLSKDGADRLIGVPNK
jgi:hypothetical protein